MSFFYVGVQTITSGQFDVLSYYDTISRFQEIDIRPILEKIIRMIVSETNGDIYKALGGNISSLDWEFTFNPLWKIGPVEKSDIDLKTAQSDHIYVTDGVIEPAVIRSKRFADLEEFEWENIDPTKINYTTEPTETISPESQVGAGLQPAASNPQKPQN